MHLTSSRPSTTRRRRRARAAGLVALTLTGMGLLAPTAQAAGLDFNYLEHPAGVVTADVLPTTQIDGVAWDQAIVNGTVYVGGSFANARPAGAAAGTNLTPRSNLLAYDLATGVLKTAFAPQVNGQVTVVVASPDRQTLYIGGSFTMVDGQPRNHIAAFNLADGQLVADFHPNANQDVNAIAPTDTTVYYGGLFTTVDGVARTRLAASSAATGTLLGWAPTADLYVSSMTFTPDGSRIALAGSFGKVNGTTALGLAFVDPTTAEAYPFAANQVIQNYGTNAGIRSVKNDGHNLLVSGWWYGGTGNFEGVASADPTSGAIRWMADCHGDTYDATAIGGYAYSVSHHHTCSNINSFPEQNPRQYERAQAFVDQASGTVRHNDAGGYFDFYGQPAPSEVDWYPEIDAGSYTGQWQGAWTAESTDTYLVLGGEFPTVNGVKQQGLVRFALPGTAPSKSGPKFTWNWNPTATVYGTQVKVSWPANVDRDAMKLTYRLYRSDTAAPIATMSEDSRWFDRPQMGYLDSGLKAGTKYSYWVTATDPDGNVASSMRVSVTAGTSTIPSTPYSQQVLHDGASHFWRLLEQPGATTSTDWAGADDLSLGSGVTLGQAGATGEPADTAAAFDGTDNGRATGTSLEQAPDTFSAELWFRTTSTHGGKLIGFGDGAGTTNSTGYDRHVYLDAAGHLHFGVWPNQVRQITSAGTYNDGDWHHVVATMGSGGMTLYADGIQVANDPDGTWGQPGLRGYWHIGGDNIGGWPGADSNDVAGTIDDVAVYPSVLSADQVRSHYVASGHTVPVPSSPTDSYGKTIANDHPRLYYRLDETSGTVVADASGNGDQGMVSGTPALGQDSTVGAPDGHSALFGQGAQVWSSLADKNPTTFSVEAWVNTTSTAGGQLVGFGDATDGLSSHHDRQVWMDPAGHLNFGLWTGQYTILTTEKSYNDGTWHHVVATLGPAGMALYVDGVAVASNSNTVAEAYTGHWHVGGDSTWTSQPYLDGRLDEVAVYDKVLDLSQVRNHYRASAAGTNQRPTSTFSAACSGATCSLDASASTDVDGTVASWTWSFDDGGTAQGITASHTFTTSGTHTVTLTVTDDQGGATTTSQQVTVDVPQAAPVAKITSQCSGLDCAFDSAGSTSAVSLTQWHWDFGDGTTSTDAAPTHSYAQAGTYTVTLTVTDANGRSDTTTATVTTTSPIASFTSDVTDLSVAVDASRSKGGGVDITRYAWDFGDGGTAEGVTAKHTYTAAGTYTVKLTVTDANGQTDTTTKDVVVTAPPNKAPVADFTSTVTNRHVALDATGSSDPDGRVTGYAWDFGDGTQGSGATTTHDYAAAGTYTITLTVTDDAGATTSTTRAVTVSDAPNQPPTAAFTSSVTDLTARFDATGSGDPDGSIATYAWDFGDGTTGTGRTVQHTYATAGSRTVTLTVTDDRGARSSVGHGVTVTTRAKPLAADDFSGTRTRWGTATVGGAWSYPLSPGTFLTNGSTGLVKVAPGVTSRAVLGNVQAGNAVMTADLSLDRLPGGDGLYASLVQRWSSRGFYSLAVRVLPTGEVHLVTYRTVGTTATAIKEVAVSGMTYKPGTTLHVRFVASGSGTTTLAGSVWADGANAPATPQVSVTDTTAAMQQPGGVGVNAYQQGSATATVRLGVDNLVVQAG